MLASTTAVSLSFRQIDRTDRFTKTRVTTGDPRSGRKRRPEFPTSPTRQITAASPFAAWRVTPVRRAMDSALLAKGRGQNDESPAWRPGLSNSLGLWGEPISQIQTPPISKDRQLKNAVFESGGAWPIDSRRQKGRPSHRDGHGASIRLRLRGAPARTDPPPQPPTRAL
jgi:hypothetical protein